MPRSARSATLRDAIGLGAAVGLYGVAFGAAAVGAGLSPGQALAMSLLMFTGASQFALVAVQWEHARALVRSRCAQAPRRRRHTTACPTR